MEWNSELLLGAYLSTVFDNSSRNLWVCSTSDAFSSTGANFILGNFSFSYFAGAPSSLVHAQ